MNCKHNRYLSGMGVLLLLHIITICLSIPYSPTFKKLSIIDSAVACIIRYELCHSTASLLLLEMLSKSNPPCTPANSSICRSTMLAFYSFPPSNGLINFIRRQFFPSSFESSNINEVHSFSQPDLSEMSVSTMPLNRLTITSENPIITTVISRTESLAISPV